MGSGATTAGLPGIVRGHAVVEAAMTPASVTIITVLYNSAEQLPAFVASLAGQTLRDWRLIAIDNASRDGSRGLVAAMNDPRVSIIDNPTNLGFARAVNQGLRAAVQADAPLVLLMNNDTVFAPEFLATLLATRARLDAAALTPRIMSIGDPNEAWYAGGHLDFDWVFRNVHETYDGPEAVASRQVDFASFCCLLLTRTVLEQIGLLDERFFVYWEDTDFCLRLKQKAIPIAYVPGLVLHHEGAASSGGDFSPHYIRLYYRSYIQLLRKHFGMAVALRSGIRILMKEAGRRGRDLRQVARTGAAMSRGVVAWPRRTPPLSPAHTPG